MSDIGNPRGTGEDLGSDKIRKLNTGIMGYERLCSKAKCFCCHNERMCDLIDDRFVCKNCNRLEKIK